MLSFIFAVSMVNVCPVDKPMKCCVSCQAKYLVCKDKSDSLSEELACLRQKHKCQGECPVGDEEDDEDASR